MESVFEKIINKLNERIEYHEKRRKVLIDFGLHEEADKITDRILELDFAKKAVEQEVTEYNNGWIPCSEQLPDECVPVNVTWINRKPEPYYAKIKDVPFSATAVYHSSKWYWYSSTCVDYLSEYGKNDFDLVDKDIVVIAWQPLPAPYQPKGE